MLRRLRRRAFDISESLVIETHQPTETRQWGERLGRALRPGDVVALIGDLGTGKTTLTQGIAQGLGIDASSVTSPSFVLMKEYRAGRIPLYHIDVYRLDGVPEMQRMGYEDYLTPQSVAVIEWAQKLGSILPSEHLAVELEHADESVRRVTIRAVGAKYDALIQQLKQTSSATSR